VAILDDAAAVTEYNEPGLGQRLWVFGLRSDGALRYRRHIRSSNYWYPWASMPGDPGYCSSHPATLSYGTAHLWVFCRATDTHIHARRFNGTSWENWIDLWGVAASGPAAAEYGSQLHVFILGTNMHIYKKICNAATTNCSIASNWTDWLDEGSPPGGCTSSPAADWLVHFYVFCRGPEASSYPKAPVWYKKWNGSAWEPWTTIPNGSAVSGPAATDFYFNGWKIYAHANTEGGHVWEVNRSSDSQPWSIWYQPWTDGFCTSTPGTSNLPPPTDYLFVICRGGGGNFYSRRWNTSYWEDWYNLGFP
jgi:hypothetical protein